ncbi:MAG: serine/threonine-protein phosphatase [Deltaproteobacteria bacterium]|nr:serine/threonine-protein phosphatase [Deltaproteobacteria bacterium]
MSNFSVKSNAWSSAKKGAPINEDATSMDSYAQIYVVSDGMGGAQRGSLASQMACEFIPRFLQSTSLGTEATWPFEKKEGLGLEENLLRMALLQTNGKIIERALHENKMEWMGCSVVAALVFSQKIVIASVGTCRAYLYRNGHLTQLTLDNSLAQYKKWLPLEPHHNIPLNFLGKTETLEIDSHCEKNIKEDDLFILVSSGMVNALPPEEILFQINKNISNFKELSNILVEAGHQRNPSFDSSALIIGI